MKTAICFVGTCRTLEHTIENLKENLIDSVEGCDIFAFVTKNPNASKITSFLDFPQTKLITIEEEPEYDEKKYVFKRKWPPPCSSRQIYLKMVFSRKRCNDVLTSYEEENGIRYDRVIFSRLDVRYLGSVGEHLHNLDPSVLGIPNFHNTFDNYKDGYNDRFAVGSRDIMDIYFKASNNLDEFVLHGGKICAESFLKWHLVKNEVEVSKIPVKFTRIIKDNVERDTVFRD